MNKQLILSASATALLTISATQYVHATPTTITDSHASGDAHGRGDVIGSDYWFYVISMDVELLADNILSVTIITNFAGRGDDSLFDGTLKAT